MTITSINSNPAAFSIINNINNAQGQISESVARLSSGNAIVNASDNVAALSIGTNLSSEVAILKVAQSNANLGTSLLQVADGALAQLQSINQQQQSLATQAASGSLDDTQRSFLDEQFQALTQQLNELASTTNFNGVSLLDGSLSQQAGTTSNTTQSTAGNATLTFTSNIASGDKVIINGVTLTSGTDFTSGSTIAQTVSNLAAVLNNPTGDTHLDAAQVLDLNQASYSAQGNTLSVTALTGGTLGGAFTINMSGNGTATGAGIGAQYGGSYQNMFATGDGFTSTSATIVAASAGVATADIPFVVGDSITATIGNNGTPGVPATTETLYTIASTDTSLQDIVNGINSRTSTTGVTATLTYDPTQASDPYNIRLSYANATAAMSVTAGANYVSTNHALNTATANFNLFTTSTNYASATTAVVATTSTAASPFQATDKLEVTLSSGATKTLVASLTSGTTLTGLVTDINATSDATGVSATLVGSAGSGFNISLSFNDPTQAQIASVNGGAHFYNQTTQAHVLNNAHDSYSVFSSALTSSTNVAFKSGATVRKASANSPFEAGSTMSIIVNGHTISASVPAMASSTVAISLTEIANAFNTATAADTYGVHVSAASGQLTVTYADPTGTTAAPHDVIFNGGTAYDASASPFNSATTTTFTANAGITYTDPASSNHQTTYGLAGGLDNGLGLGSTTATGSVGDDILTSLGQAPAQVAITFPDIAANDLTSTSGFGTAGSVYITVAGQNFVFTTTTAADKAANEITIGSSLQQTLNNAVSTINSYLANGDATGNQAYQLNQLQVATSGNSLIFTGKGLSQVSTISGAVSNVAISGFTGVSATNGGNLDNQNLGGVDATGVSNSAFTGTVSGFSATYSSANTVNATIKVGNYTYTASGVDTDPTTGNETVRFISNTASDGSNGGYFDVFLQSNDGQAVSNQSDADTFAQRLNSAFSSLTFQQQRQISSYSGTQTIVTNGTVTGSLIGTSVSAQLPNFTNARLDSVSVTAPSGSGTDAQISLDINGETFTTAAGIGTQLGANQTYKLVSTSNANDYVNFTTGNSVINIATAAEASSFQTALDSAFGVSSSSAALSFQVGSTSADTINVSIANVSSSAIFNGQSLSIATQAGAEAASTALVTANNTITAVRANVGAQESQFQFASAALASSVQNQSSAEGGLLDTDIASESTNFANEQVQLQAGISVLAQANQLQQAVLKLIA